MRNNKGYTLVELLVTLAVFSIVMVSIVTLMSTTANTYGKGQRETELQEEAQIVANQIENMIIDAPGPATWDASIAGYKIPSGTGATYNYIRQDGNKIMYSDNGSIWVPLAEYVDSFGINNTDATDNKVSVVVNMESGKEIIDATTGLGTGIGEANYSFEKTVYYRNQVESLANFTIESGSSPASSGGGSNEYNLFVDRFETYNLKSLKDIDHFETDPSTGNVLVHGASTDATRFVCQNKKFDCKGTNGTDHVDGAFVKCSDITNTNFTASVSSADGVYVNGYTKDGTLIKVNLLLDPVYFDQGSGVFVHQGKTDINDRGNRGLYVTAYGINMYNAVKQGLNVSCDICYYLDSDNSGSITSADTTKWFTGKTLGTTDDQSYRNTPGQCSALGLDQLNIGIAADDSSGDIAIISPNGFDGNANADYIKNNKLRYHVEMSFSKGGSSIACPGDFDVSVRVAGKTGD